MVTSQNYTVAWICSATTEYDAAKAFLDETHDAPVKQVHGDRNTYTLGRVGKRNIVIVLPRRSEHGLVSETSASSCLKNMFPTLKSGLMVGIGGGAPSQEHDIRLGDIVVGTEPSKLRGEVPADPLEKTVGGKLRSDHMMEGNRIRGAVSQALDSNRGYLCGCMWRRSGQTGRETREGKGHYQDDPAVHYGIIFTGHRSIRDATRRDKLSAKHNFLCSEEGAAYFLPWFPCVVIRGIYYDSDSHENTEWRGYAAMTARCIRKNNCPLPVRALASAHHLAVANLNSL
ncbi:purine and uridine phosphorylase [Trichoderma velutinum]